MKVLHLIDQPGMALGAERRTEPDAALLACAMLRRRLPEFDQSVCLIGGSELEERAAGAGLATTDRISPPLGKAVRAPAGLRALLRDRGRPDVIHCWSRATADLAEGFGLPIGLTALDAVEPSIPGAPEQIPVARWAPGVYDSPSADSPARAVRHAAIPRVDLPASPDGRRGLRAELGVAEDEPVLLLIGGRPGEADAVRLEFCGGLLHFSHRPVVWLVPGSAARLPRALRFHARSAWGYRLIVTDRPFAEQVAGADLGVWLGGAWADAAGVGPSAAAGTLIGAAMAAGLPVVAPRSALIAPLYSGAAGAECLAFNGTLAEVARKLLPLADDPARRAALREAVAGAAPRPPGSPLERVVADQWLACRGSRADAYAPRA